MSDDDLRAADERAKRSDALIAAVTDILALTAERDAARTALARIADLAQQWGDGTDRTREMGDIAKEALK